MKFMITGHRPTKLGGWNRKDPLNLSVKEWIADCLTRSKARYPKLEVITETT